MQLFMAIPAAIGSVFTGGAAAGTAAGAAGAAAGAAGAAGAATSAFSLGGIGKWLAFGSTALGAIAEYGASQAQASALEGQALWEDFRAKNEKIEGEHAAARELALLNEDMGKLLVAGYASGLQGSGSVEAAQEEAKEIGEYNVAVARDNAEIRAGSRRSQAQQYRQEASATRSGGIFKALGHGFNFFSRTLGRG